VAGKGRCIDQRSARRAIYPSISSLSLEPDASDSKPSSSVQRAIANRWFQYSALLFRCRQSHQPRQVGGPWAHGVLSLSSRISLMIFFSSSLGVPEPRFEGTAARVGIPSDTQEKKGKEIKPGTSLLQTTFAPVLHSPDVPCQVVSVLCSLVWSKKMGSGTRFRHGE